MKRYYYTLLALLSLSAYATDDNRAATPQSQNAFTTGTLTHLLPLARAFHMAFLRDQFVQNNPQAPLHEITQHMRIIEQQLIVQVQEALDHQRISQHSD